MVTARLGNASSASATSRVLPAPASPVTDTIALRPLATIAMIEASSSHCVERPTNATSWNRGTDPRDPTPASRDPPHPHLLRSATNVERVDRLAQDLLGGERLGRVADQDAAGLGQALQPRGHVDHVAHRGVLGGARHVADDHLAGVDADPQLGADRRGRVARRRIARAISCICSAARIGSVGVVLVGHGRPEQREDPVSEHLVDPAAEGRDVGDQPLEAGVDQPLDPLGVEVLGQRRVPDEVGEHDRDHPTLLGGRAAQPRGRTQGRTVAPSGSGSRHEAQVAHQRVIVRHVRPWADHRAVPAARVAPARG